MRSSTYYYEVPGIYDWVQDDKRELIAQGDLPIEEIGYSMLLKGLYNGLAVNAVLCYFLVSKLNIKGVRSMMYSSSRQRSFVWVVIEQLKQYKLGGYKQAFNHDISKIEKRIKFVRKMCMENIRLTEYYPYFQQPEAEAALTSFSTKFRDHEKTPLDDLVTDIIAWNEVHKEKVASHVESVKDEVALVNKRDLKRKEDSKNEKRMIREARRKEKEQIAEYERNKKKKRSQENKWQKEMNGTIRMVDRMGGDG